MEVCSLENLRVTEEVKSQIPVYHTRTMKQQFYDLYGRITPKSNSFVLRSIYHSLTGDCSGARSTSEEEMDNRVTEALAMQDPDFIVDLRHLNSNESDRFTVFWEKCTQYLSTCTAVHERRHDTVTFMAKAISVRDLIQEVTKLCPEGTPIPSQAWVHLNFCPRNPHSLVAQRYTGRLQAKHMIQKRQFRKSHPDSHYCAAIFRYMRDYAIKFRDISLFACIDDKHRVKVGEPGYPVAAAERGRQVIVSSQNTFAVGDHDFCKFSFIPSVTLLVDIPERIECSWYSGQVFVGIKDAAFEPSSQLRHATELYNCLVNQMEGRHILFVYSDGGPDHRLTYASVQISLIAIFLNLDLDLLIAGRTAPSHSWANPVERIMSIVNLGMQCIGVMREKMGDEFEKAVKSAKNIKDIRKSCSGFKSDVSKSLKSPKDLIASIITRLELKGRKFEVFESASKAEIDSFFDVLLKVDSLITKDHTTRKAFESLTSLKSFISHCCLFRKYAITIKKCGKSDCSICLPVRMSSDIFKG